MNFKINKILINQETKPIGIDVEKPVFSWEISGENGVKQVNYRIIVNRKTTKEVVWDTGKNRTDNSICIKYGGEKLESMTEYELFLEVWDQNEVKQIASTSFETGLMNSSINAWNGAKWIGAPEFYVAADTQSVFSIESKITIESGGCRAGIVFGANDKRLMDRTNNEMLLEGRNYISYVLDVEHIPAKIDIFRVGYDKTDREDIPFASVDVVDEETQESIITEENRNDAHILKVQVMGNTAYAFVDGKRVDSVIRKTFGGEKKSPRQLNPLGFNDVTTYPRLCEIGYYVDKYTKAHFDGIILRNVRTPGAIIAEYDTGTGRQFDAKEEKVIEVFAPSQHALPMLRRDFLLEKEVESARLYATARGIYTVQVNGEKLTDQYFMPGASQYDKHIMYQTFDITDRIFIGQNGIAFTLASGWWSEMSTYALYNFNYWGDKPALLAMIVINYKDGSKEKVITDCEKWQYYGEGPFLYSGFFNGEQFDGSKRWIYENFSKPGFTIDKMKKPVEINTTIIRAEKTSSPLLPGWEDVNLTEPEIVGSFNAPVRSVEYFHPKSMRESAKNVYIYDLGQEIAGIATIRFHGERGTKVWIRYGEMLYPELSEYGELSGTILQANLREASNTDLYILSGEENDIFSPEFTFHGFRYIENGGGILVIPEKEVPKFKSLLVRYYEGENISIISNFMKKNCWKKM
ncbi:MAG: family 78 glycoside hydrolase catalytic domain [Catonella sp.]